MKEKYINITNDYFDIFLPERFEKFGYEVLDYSTTKLREYLDFFKKDSYEQVIRGAFLTSHDDFINRIKDLKSEEDNMPPLWATGCFYGGETQILVNDSPYDCYHVLVHETFHLLFNKYVYDGCSFEKRIIWLDEALAGNFDDTTGKLVDNGSFKKLIEKYMNTTNLPVMTNFNFDDDIFNTKEYQGYELFKIIGRYLIESKNKDELLEYIRNYDKVMEDSKTILRDSISYFVIKYDIKKNKS